MLVVMDFSVNNTVRMPCEEVSQPIVDVVWKVLELPRDGEMSPHCGCLSPPLFAFLASPRGRYLSMALQVRT